MVAYQTIVEFDKTIMLHRKLATGSIHDNLFCYCPLVGILFEELRNMAIGGDLTAGEGHVTHTPFISIFLVCISDRPGDSDSSCNCVCECPPINIARATQSTFLAAIALAVVFVLDKLHLVW